MQKSGTVSGFSLSTSVFASEIFPPKLLALPLICLSPMLYNFSKLLNNITQRTAVRTADSTTGGISRAVLHCVSYDLIEHSIAHVSVRLAEFSIFVTVTAFRKHKRVTG